MTCCLCLCFGLSASFCRTIIVRLISILVDGRAVWANVLLFRYGRDVECARTPYMGEGKGGRNVYDKVKIQKFKTISPASSYSQSDVFRIIIWFWILFVRNAKWLLHLLALMLIASCGNRKCSLWYVIG